MIFANINDLCKYMLLLVMGKEKTQQDLLKSLKTLNFIQGDIKKCLTTGNAAAAAKSLQSCPTLCDPIDLSPPGSPVPGILQARTLEWGPISFSNA